MSLMKVEDDRDDIVVAKPGVEEHIEDANVDMSSDESGDEIQPLRKRIRTGVRFKRKEATDSSGSLQRRRAASDSSEGEDQQQQQLNMHVQPGKDGTQWTHVH